REREENRREELAGELHALYRHRPKFVVPFYLRRRFLVRGISKVPRRAATTSRARPRATRRSRAVAASRDGPDEPPDEPDPSLIGRRAASGWERDFPAWLGGVGISAAPASATSRACRPSTGPASENTPTHSRKASSSASKTAGDAWIPTRWKPP